MPPVIIVVQDETLDVVTALAENLVVQTVVAEPLTVTPSAGDML